MRGASRREAWIERAGRENFVQEGHCKYCDSRNRQSAVYFGLLLLLRASPPAAPPLCDSGVRSEKGRTPTRLLSPSNLSSRFFSRNKRLVVSSKLPPLSLFLPSVFPSVVNYYREKESRIFFRFLWWTNLRVDLYNVWIPLRKFVFSNSNEMSRSKILSFYFPKFPQISVTDNPQLGTIQNSIAIIADWFSIGTRR